MKILLLPFLLFFGFYTFGQETLRINKRKTTYKSCGSPNLYANAFELSNGEYLRYVNWVAENHGREAYLAALPDTLVWNTQYSYNSKFVTYYFRHPAYANHPVVGLSYEQAQAYCEWLSQQTNASLADPNIKRIVFRLPTEAEWEKAALGGLPEQNLYPWGSTSLIVEKGKYKGYTQANLMRTRYAKNVVVYTLYNGHNYFESSDNTYAVNALQPNGYGIYNMIGNVAEMIANAELAKGGSWSTYLYGASIQSAEKREQPTNAHVGLRIFAEIAEYHCTEKAPKIDARFIDKASSLIPSTEGVFFIYNYEVSNALYGAYLKTLEGEKLKKALPADSLWQQETNCLQYQAYHTQFPNYPVCNIDKAAMLGFCDWLEGVYNSDPKRKHDQIELSLPTYDQWYEAAGGADERLYAWLSNSVSDPNANFLMNFNPLPEHLFIDPYLYRKDSSYQQLYRAEIQKARADDGYELTCPVDAFYLYKNNDKLAHLKKNQMNGNVAEALLDSPLVMGGSFASFAFESCINDEYDIQNPNDKCFGQEITLPSPQVGFRFIYRVK